MNYIENDKLNLKGHIQMTMFKGDYINNEIKGEILKQYEEHNLIVAIASKFLAARMIPPHEIIAGTPCYQITADPTIDENGIVTSTTSSILNNDYPLPYGFQYLALGNGHLTEYSDDQTAGEYLFTADTHDTIDNQRTFTTLYHETLRKPITNWAFVDSNYNISTVVTDTLRLTTLVDYHDFNTDNTLNYWIVEMGLFGGNATNDLNTGYMFNYRAFKAWNMIQDSKLLINWYIQF